MRTPQWNLPDISRRTKHRPATAPPSTRWPAGYAAYLLPGRQTARINAVAPGNTTTPMTKGMTEKQMDAALLIPIPTRYGRKEFLDASEIANAMVFLLSPLASGINGVILFVDGGIDALLRSNVFNRSSNQYHRREQTLCAF